MTQFDIKKGTVVAAATLLLLLVAATVNADEVFSNTAVSDAEATSDDAAATSDDAEATSTDADKPHTWTWTPVGEIDVLVYSSAACHFYDHVKNSEGEYVETPYHLKKGNKLNPESRGRDKCIKMCIEDDICSHWVYLEWKKNEQNEEAGWLCLGVQDKSDGERYDAASISPDSWVDVENSECGFIASRLPES